MGRAQRGADPVRGTALVHGDRRVCFVFLRRPALPISLAADWGAGMTLTPLIPDAVFSEIYDFDKNACDPGSRTIKLDLQFLDPGFRRDDRRRGW